MANLEKIIGRLDRANKTINNVIVDLAKDLETDRDEVKEMRDAYILIAYSIDRLRKRNEQQH